jgi:hypothetical protein
VKLNNPHFFIVGFDLNAMDLNTFIAHIPTYPFHICNHLMAAFKAMCDLNIGCWEEWGDWLTCPECSITCGYSILDQPKGNISIDYVESPGKKYYLQSQNANPPIYREKSIPQLRCMEDHHNA